MIRSEIITLITILILVIIFIICSVWAVKTAYAFVENPPVIDDVSMYNWLGKIQQGANQPALPLVTTNPDGNRYGKEGDMVWYYSSNGMYLAICASPPTVWRGLKLEMIEAESW